MGYALTALLFTPAANRCLMPRRFDKMYSAPESRRANESPNRMNTESLSLDKLIKKLTQLRDSGVPGSIATAIPAADNNGRGGYFQRIEGASRVAVAKADHEKEQGLCRAVAARGVDVLVIR